MSESTCEKKLPLWELEKSYLGRESILNPASSQIDQTSFFYSHIIKSLEDKESFETHFEFALTSLEKLSVASHQDLAKALQKFTTLLVLGSHFSIEDHHRDRCIALLILWKKRHTLEGYQLINALFSLCSFFACHESDVFSLQQFDFGGALPEWGYQSDESHLFSSQECSELAVISSILAFLQKNKDLYFSSMKLVEFHLHLLDARKKPIKAVFTSESNYSETNELLLSDFLKTILSKDIRDVNVASIASQESFYALYLECLKSLLFPLLKESSWSYKPQILLQSHSLGFAVYEYNDFSAFTTVCGNNSGLGSITKGDTQIISFGPQKEPLYDMSSFGVMRTLDIEQESLDDIECTQNAESLFFRGWTRFFFSSKNEQEGDLDNRWLQITTDIQKDRYKLKIRFYDNLSFDGYFLSFYVKADSITLGESLLTKGSLESLDGAHPTITLRTSESVLHIKSLFETDVKIIPLSGKDAFYGADFLISYKIDLNIPEFIWDIY